MFRLMKSKKKARLFLGKACQKEKDICDSYDLNDDGYITQTELFELFPSEDSIHQYFHEIDEDKDEKITINDCAIIVRTIGFRLSLQ